MHIVPILHVLNFSGGEMELNLGEFAFYRLYKK